MSEENRTERSDAELMTDVRGLLKDLSEACASLSARSVIAKFSNATIRPIAAGDPVDRLVLERMEDDVSSVLDVLDIAQESIADLGADNLADVGEQVARCEVWQTGGMVVEDMRRVAGSTVFDFPVTPGGYVRGLVSISGDEVTCSAQSMDNGAGEWATHGAHTIKATNHDGAPVRLNDVVFRVRSIKQLGRYVARLREETKARETDSPLMDAVDDMEWRTVADVGQDGGWITAEASALRVGITTSAGHEATRAEVSREDAIALARGILEGLGES